MSRFYLIEGVPIHVAATLMARVAGVGYSIIHQKVRYHHYADVQVEFVLRAISGAEVEVVFNYEQESIIFKSGVYKTTILVKTSRAVTYEKAFNDFKWYNIDDELRAAVDRAAKTWQPKACTPVIAANPRGKKHRATTNNIIKESTISQIMSKASSLGSNRQDFSHAAAEQNWMLNLYWGDKRAILHIPYGKGVQTCTIYPDGGITGYETPVKKPFHNYHELLDILDVEVFVKL